MRESDQEVPGQVVQCATVRDVIERYGPMGGAYSLTVCAESDGTAVLKLVTADRGTTVTLVADASWLAVLWRMRPGDRRPARIAALTTALEAHARVEGGPAVGVLP
ncbi:hypothetical protein GCM10029964_060690 [Kibdelosporangium lantanae]